jgi:hypothetical protein
MRKACRLWRIKWSAANPSRRQKKPGQRAHHRQPGSADAIYCVSQFSSFLSLVQSRRGRDCRIDVALWNIFTLLQLGHHAVDLLNLAIQIGLRMWIL